MEMRRRKEISISESNKQKISWKRVNLDLIATATNATINVRHQQLQKISTMSSKKKAASLIVCLTPDFVGTSLCNVTNPFNGVIATFLPDLECIER